MVKNPGGLYLKASPSAEDAVVIQDDARSGLPVLARLGDLGAAVGAYTPRQAAYQAVAYASTITIEPTLGAVVQVGALTGNIVIAAPTSPQNGDTLCILLKQDATGGRTVTWNAAFATGSLPVVDTAANARTQATFVYADSVWQ